ncbi:MAG: aspartate carbamoyltransferase catalytic subunit [Cystobacterineae bacterium]|nr:aspartate carbamoyltransferase catalytic subunit [Cystobacterineae bacterium]
MIPHLLSIRELSREDVLDILERASRLKREGACCSALAGKVVVNLFYEPSTRTSCSFEVAAAGLGAHVLNWNVASSSSVKGETLLDTARNLAAMGVFAFVIRHPNAGAPALVARHINCAVVNAGDGRHEHPSQALLDAFTLKEKWGDLEGRHILIVGDVLHSRVARSNLYCLKLLGAKVSFCGPPSLVPKAFETLGTHIYFDLDEALKEADAVMMLRLQKERQTEALIPSVQEYHRRWGLDLRRLSQLKRGAFVMHPGPVNRGLEMASEAMEGPSNLILEQVSNGVIIRQAILESLQ